MSERIIRKYTILIFCLLYVQLLWGQRRFEVSEPEEYFLGGLIGFTFKDVDNKVDAFWGLHFSQYVGVHHLFGFSAEGAWSSFTTNMPIASMRPGGGAVGAHFLYEYQYSGLLIQTGIGVNLQQVYTNVRDTDIYHYDMHDKWEGVESASFTLKHEFRHRQDMSRNIYAQVPLYVGQYLFSPAGVWYYLAGFHFNYAFMGDTKQNLVGTTKAQYEPFLGVWHEMDNHGYRKDVPIERKGERLKLKMDVLLHGEFGYEYTTFNHGRVYITRPGDRIDCRVRFAAFADFGIRNICPRTDNVLYGLPRASIYDFPTYRIDHVFSTADAKALADLKSCWMRNLYAGIRITVLFGLPWQEKCILCDPGKH